MNAKRQKAEELIYKVMDKFDTTGQNTAYYKSLFANMNDAQFEKFCRKDLCIRFHTKPFSIEPNMSDIENGLAVLKVPLLETVSIPDLYVNKKGQAVTTHKCMVIYMHLKRMKQFITKKNSMSTGRDARDMKTGLLLSEDKNGKTTDREIEAMAVMGMTKTSKELTTWRADYMDAKSVAYQTISATGKISSKDIDLDPNDSLAKNMLNCYLLSAGIYTNILNVDYMLPRTLANRQKKIIRQ